MVPYLWNRSIHGGIGFVTDDAVITAPRFGDGNWRGGTWANYDRRTGECRWNRQHGRGAEVADVIGDVLIATTYKYSGVYALSMLSGARLWYRLGDRFDWLLKLFDKLPIHNAGDAPERIWRGSVLTRSGRLLNAATGSVESYHSLEYSTGNPRTLIQIDGEAVSPFFSARHRDCFQLHEVNAKPVEALLAKHGLELASYHPCVATAHGVTVAVACTPPKEFNSKPGSRLYVGGSTEHVQHFLVVSESDCTTILRQYDLGSFYVAELDWADESFFSITAQTRHERFSTYRRNLWVFEWSSVK